MEERILIYGAGEAGELILNELGRRKQQKQVVGFIDDDLSKIGSTIGGFTVVGGKDDVFAIIENYSVTRVIVAIPSAQSERIKALTAALKEAFPHIVVLFLPSLMKYFSASLMRELVESEWADLIERKEASYDVSLFESFFEDKTVLVTGAGGSIGSELSMTLLRLGVKKLVCLGRGEGSIYRLSQKIRTLKHNSDVEYIIADVRDERLLEKKIAATLPDAVFHAAAHKHVPLMEADPAEAMSNNVYGSYNLLKVCEKCGVTKFIFISTDKAVYPSSVMGATKRLGEHLTAAFNGRMKTHCVRFGNVIGSQGSVIPLFYEQITRGGPVTITDPEAERFFMTIPEAALLVVHSAVLSKGGETFVLNMGRPYTIQEIAEKMIRNQGLIPGEDIPIEYIGYRDGEKKSEVLFYDDEVVEKLKGDLLWCVYGSGGGLTDGELAELEAYKEQIYCEGDDEIRKKIFHFAGEFSLTK